MNFIYLKLHFEMLIDDSLMQIKQSNILYDNFYMFM